MTRRRQQQVSVTLSVVAVLALLGSVWIRAWNAGYELFGDTAVIVLRARDVFGPGSPLLGMPSAFSAWSNIADPMHPGPAVFWFMAPTAYLIGGPAGSLVGTFLITALAAVFVVVSVARRIGPVGAPAGAGLVLVAMGMGSFTIWEPLNPSIAVLVLVVVFVSAWSVLDRDGWAWPVLAFAASAVVQLDLSFLPSTSVLVVVVLGISARRWWWERRTRGTGGRSGRRRRIAVTSGVVLAVMWSLPMVDAVANGGGNLAELLRAMTAGVPVRGLPAVLRAFAISLGPMVVLSPLLLVAWRRDRPARRALIVTGCAAGLGAALGQGLVPAGEVNSLVWVPLAVSAVFAWFATTVVVVDVLVGSGQRRSLSLRIITWPLLAAVAVSALNRLPSTYVPWGAQYFPAIEHLGAAIERLPAGRYRVRPLGAPYGVAVALGLMRSTDRSQVHLEVGRPLARYVGENRLADGRESRALYVTINVERPPVLGATLVGRWRSAEFHQGSSSNLVRRVSEQVRTAPTNWSPTASDFFVGSIAAEGGSRARQTTPIRSWNSVAG